MEAGELAASVIIHLPPIALDRIPISQRAITVCNRIGIMTLHQLLLTSATRLLDEPGFGIGTLRNVHSSVRRFFLEPADKARRIDYASFDAMVRSFVDVALHPRVTNLAFVRNPRNKQIVLERLGLGLPRTPTLRELGARHGISKERVRQIVSVSRSIMRSEMALPLLGRFWETVDMRAGHGASHKGWEPLAIFLRSRFSWKETPSAHVLAGLCSLRSGPRRQTSRPDRPRPVDDTRWRGAGQANLPNGE
jgi:hypothetical protein